MCSSTYAVRSLTRAPSVGFAADEQRTGWTNNKQQDLANRNATKFTVVLAGGTLDLTSFIASRCD